MHIIAYVTQNLYINNHEIIIAESNKYIPHKFGQQEQVRVGSQQWQTSPEFIKSRKKKEQKHGGHKA